MAQFIPVDHDPFDMAGALQPQAIPSGQRPLVGGGPMNAIDMLLQSSPVAKAKSYAQMLYEAAKLPGDLASGRQASFPGLRREDYSDDPNAPDPNQHLTQSAVSLGDIMSMGGHPISR